MTTAPTCSSAWTGAPRSRVRVLERSAGADAAERELGSGVPAGGRRGHADVSRDRVPHRHADGDAGRRERAGRGVPRSLHPISQHDGLACPSVPCGLDGRSLPVGLQIMGKPFDEATVLRVGHGYEKARGAFPVPRHRCITPGITPAAGQRRRILCRGVHEAADVGPSSRRCHRSVADGASVRRGRAGGVCQRACHSRAVQGGPQPVATNPSLTGQRGA